MELSFSNFNMCCRLCLSENLDSVKSILDDRSLQQKITTSVGVEVQLGDKFSTMICIPCVDIINQFNKFKQSCLDNQLKLEQWLHLQNGGDCSDMSIQIKEEPIDHDIIMTPVITNVKTEPRDIEDEPPLLTPQATEDHKDLELPNSSNAAADADGSFKCGVCGKGFSKAVNMGRHEKIAHKNRRRRAKPRLTVVKLDGDDSDDDKADVDGEEADGKDESEVEPLDEEEKKILFAAGLKLLGRSSTPPITQEPLSKIEMSYIEKCKAMYTQYKSLVCACHEVPHPNIKGLLSHLRSLRIWFPVFTCYHCMITFTDRSASTKHHLRCSRKDLETLLKLSNLKKRSEVKTRLYQNYKCKKCRFMFSFHEDFMTHVDEDHSEIRLPKKCSCGRVFTTLEDYKDHAYVSCLVEYYCDVCFVTLKSLEAFKKHGAEVHDNSEGFVLLQDDGYRQKKKMIAYTQDVKRLDPVDEALPAKRPRRSLLPICDEEEEKVINPVFAQKIPGTKCPLCSKEYSSNNNMLRHYRTHAANTTEETYDNSLYCCPDCGGMFSTAEWEKHKETHKKKLCEECGKEFQFQAELDHHRSIHLNIKICRDSKTHAYKSTMMNNSNSDDNIAVVCDICDTMFISKEQLKEHKLIHEKMPVLESAVEGDMTPSNKYQCNLCPKSYPAYSSLYDHNKKKHPENKTPRNRGQVAPIAPNLRPAAPDEEDVDTEAESYFTCKRCFKVFSSRGALKNHMKCHGITMVSPKNKIAKKVWCNMCHTAFDTPEKLDRHKAEDHCRDSKDFIPKQEEMSLVFSCDICVRTFNSKVALKKHKEQHEKEKHQQPVLYVKSKNTIPCRHCKIPFANPEQLKIHMNREHAEKPKKFGKEKAKQHACNICRKTFSTHTALCAHQGWHKRGKIANKFVRSSKAMPKPIMVKEEPDDDCKVFQCKTCYASLPNDTALQIHILEKHRNVNAIVVPPRCAMCNLDFNTAEEYDRHQQFHTAVEIPQAKKSYPCSNCTLAFTRPDALNAHIAQSHKYVCNQCDRVFDKQTSLSIHLKVHEKQKVVTGNSSSSSSSTSRPKFSCSICNKGFQLPKDLRTHTIQAHPF